MIIFYPVHPLQDTDLDTEVNEVNERDRCQIDLETEEMNYKVSRKSELDPHESPKYGQNCLQMKFKMEEAKPYEQLKSITYKCAKCFKIFKTKDYIKAHYTKIH